MSEYIQIGFSVIVDILTISLIIMNLVAYSKNKKVFRLNLKIALVLFVILVINLVILYQKLQLVLM